MANMQIGKLTVIGNKARMEQLSANVRKEIASNAAKVRWNKVKAKTNACIINPNNRNWCDKHNRPLSRCENQGLLPK